MKALIVSDIHANVIALEEIWKREKDSDVIYCAGDLVDYGPYPKQVIEWLREHQVICVKGNHDKHVALLYRSGKLWDVSDDERTWAHDNAQKLDEEHILYLEKLPNTVAFSMDSVDYCMQHMYRGYDTIQSLVHFNTFWEQQTSRTIGDALQPRRMIFGHTHRRAVHQLSDNDLWLNPGSTSYRRNDDPTKVAHYMTIIDQQIQFKELSYDRSPLMKATMAAVLSMQERRTAEIFFGKP